MGTTTRYTWPYPEESDTPDVPSDMTILADAVEETVGAIDDRVTTLTGLSQSIMQFTTLTRVSTNVMSIPNGAWTPIIWDAAQYNLPTSNPGFVFASPTRITIKETGLYRATGFAGLAQNVNGNRALAVRTNANASYAAIASGDAPTGIEWYGTVCVEARWNANDFVELCLRQTSGGSLDMDTVQPRFSMQRLL
jgi:hypothetical protein